MLVTNEICGSSHVELIDCSYRKTLLFVEYYFVLFNVSSHSVVVILVHYMFMYFVYFCYNLWIKSILLNCIFVMILALLSVAVEQNKKCIIEFLHGQ